MRARFSRHGGGGRPRRRWAVFSAASLAVLVGLGWIAPTLLVLTELRDRPLVAAFQGIAGRVASRGATWSWLRGLEYRNVMLLDREQRPVLAVQRVLIDRGLVALAIDPTDLGTIRLVGCEAIVEVRRGGSNVEDILAPWLATFSGPSQSAPAFELEVVDGAVELVDLARNDAWRITELTAAGTVRHSGSMGGWTVSGRILHAGEPARDLAAFSARPARAGTEAGLPGHVRLDRTTIAAAATATLARDGGWSLSSPQPPTGEPLRSLVVSGNRVPLGVSSIWATRFDVSHLVDGLADVRLDLMLPSAGSPAGALQVAGTVSGSTLALCRSDTLAEIVAIDHLDVPLDLTCDGRTVMIRTLKATSALFQAEASGRLGLPRDNSWAWAEALVESDFALAAEIDLKAAARSIPGGLTLREDVQVTAGQLQLAASAHPDGAERVLEVRAVSRDLAAVQGERQLRWNEPFTAWLRGRRGPGRGERLRIEEARVASPAVEVSATGTVEAASVQWTIDIDALAREAAEVFDLDGVKLAGTSRGRVDVKAAEQSGASNAVLSASLSNFEAIAPGRFEWRDEELTLEAECRGSTAGGAAIVDAAHAVLAAGDDRLEMTLTGAAIVNPAALVPTMAWQQGERAQAPLVRAAAQADGVTADWTLAGELGRWQARCAAVTGGGFARATLGGKVLATAALGTSGDVWQIRRAAAEIEKFTASTEARKIVEPRVVASAAGAFDPATGRVEISSAEMLTATVSLRTGGVMYQPARRPTPAGGEAFDLVDRVRGKMQWQADVGRLAKWLMPPAVVDVWPAGGRTWGTIEVIDTPTGVNLLVDATGNQLSLAHAQGVGGGAQPREVWAEPRARLLLEMTRGSVAGGALHTADERLVVNRLALESSTVAVSAAGGIDDVSSRQMTDLVGTVVYDWEMLSRLLIPWTGGRVRLTGGGARPFAVRAPLGTVLAAIVPGQTRSDPAVPAGDPGGAPQTAREVPLPDDWLSAVRGRTTEPEAGRLARVTLPVAPPRAQATYGEWLRPVAAETSAAWTAADVDGFRIDAGEMDVRLFEGQLALGPFEIAASGGRLRGAPWLRLLPLPGELVVPPGRVVDRVALSSRFCEEWVSWVVPLIGRSTRTQGVVSVDVSGARLPLGDPFGGELSGQLIFENLEVTPGPQLQPLVGLIVKLQSVIDPRFAFGDKAVLLRVRPEPVRMRLAERRLWHEGLVMDMGQLTIRSSGSVGADGSLAMVAEVALRGDIAGGVPVIGQLLRTPLAIPLRGTVERPQFDAGAIDKILGRIVENTAEAVISDGLSRGLEEFFGNPQPAAVPK
jgi:hypothetical protein